MKERFLRRMLGITKSFNVALWITAIIVAITAGIVVIQLNTFYVESESFLMYWISVFITALAIMFSFVVILGIIFSIFTIVNGIIKKYLSNQKRPH